MPVIVTQFIMGPSISLFMPVIIVNDPKIKGMARMYTMGCIEHPFFQFSFASSQKGGSIIATNEPKKRQAIAEHIIPNHHLLPKSSTRESGVLNPEIIHSIIKQILIVFPNFIFLNSEDALIGHSDGISSRS